MYDIVRIMRTIKGNMKKVCKKCKGDLELDFEYDAHYCPKCKIWFEEKCPDPECDFCYNRPEFPNI